VSPVRLWPVCRQRGAGLSGAFLPRQTRQKTLSLQDSGVWVLAGAGGGAQDLWLTHAWPAFAWMTLRFRTHHAVAAEPLELTIGKPGLTDHAWRELRICV